MADMNQPKVHGETRVMRGVGSGTRYKDEVPMRGGVSASGM